MASIFITMDILFFWNCGAFVVDLRPRAADCLIGRLRAPAPAFVFPVTLPHMAPLCYLLINGKGKACVGAGNDSAFAYLAAHNARAPAGRPWRLRAAVRGFATLREARLFHYAWENGFSPRTRSMRGVRKAEGVARYRTHFDSMSALCMQNNVVRASFSTERGFKEALLNLLLSMDKWQHLMFHLYPMHAVDVPALAVLPAPAAAPAPQFVVAAGDAGALVVGAGFPAALVEYEDSIMDPGDSGHPTEADTTEAEEEL